jgi:hypothetical protein
LFAPSIQEYLNQRVPPELDGTGDTDDDSNVNSCTTVVVVDPLLKYFTPSMNGADMGKLYYIMMKMEL